FSIRPSMSSFFRSACRYTLKARARSVSKWRTLAELRPRARLVFSSAVCCRLLLRVENQLLHAPVQDFSDVKLVFGWACHFVNPAELFELLAGFAEHAQDLSVQT